MKCLIHVYFKKPRIWQVFWYMTWYGKHIRKKYRWRQVLWADALIQMPRKTGERNLRARFAWRGSYYVIYAPRITSGKPQVPFSIWSIHMFDMIHVDVNNHLQSTLLRLSPCRSTQTSRTVQQLCRSHHFQWLQLSSQTNRRLQKINKSYIIKTERG